MRVAKVKVMASQKVYWLTEKQAGVIEQLTQSGQYASKLIPLGEDRVKLSAVKTIEFEEEDLNIAPNYFKDAVKRENAGELPEPKKNVERLTKTYDVDGNEMFNKSWIALCNEAQPFIERDFEVLSKKYVTNPKTGKDELTYELGAMLEERTITFKAYMGYIAPTIISRKVNGVEKLCY